MKNEKLLNYALESLKKGISVILVGKNKRPLIPWKEFQTRYATEEEVRGWFDKLDDPQIGFCTGKISNLTVVDVEEGGDPSFLPQDTTIVKTGGNGYHYFYKFEEGINNKARIKELVDIRGEGGYVVSPNSVSDKGSYSILQEKPLLKFPRELFPEKVNIFNSPESRKNMIFDKRELDSYTGFSKGQRNDEMARYIGYVLTQVHPADWDSEGFSIIEKANNLNSPPLNSRELLATFESIKSIERRNNPLGHLQTNTGNNRIQNNYEDPNILPDDTDDEIMHIAEAADLQKINQDEVYPLGFDVFDEAILGGVCPGDVITIGGQPGHGKTSLCQEFTIKMLRSEKAPKALWFSYEVLASHLWTKFQEMGMTRKDCAFIPANHSTGNIEWVEKKIKEGKEKFGTKLVFIDHLGFLLPKTRGILGNKNMSSNYSTFLTQIMRDLKSIAIKEEVIIFLPVHMKKPNFKSKVSEIEDISGSAGPAQESDLVFIIERIRETDAERERMFTGESKISLAKNRKTGISLKTSFNMLEGRFVHDSSAIKAKKMFEEIGKSIDENEKNEVKKEEVKKVDEKPEKDLSEEVAELWDKEMK